MCGGNSPTADLVFLPLALPAIPEAAPLVVDLGTVARTLVDPIVRAGTVVLHLINPEVEIDTIPELPSITETSPEYSGAPRPLPQTTTQTTSPPEYPPNH